MLLLAVTGCRCSQESTSSAPSGTARESEAPLFVPGDAPGSPGPASAPSAGEPALAESDSPAVSVDMPPVLVPPERRRGDESAGAICGDYGIPCPSELVHLCGRRELGPGGARLYWDAFASDDPLEELAAFFRARLGERGSSESSNGMAWTLPGSSGGSSRRLELLAAGTPGRQDACETHPQPGARSVLVMSREE